MKKFITIFTFFAVMYIVSSVFFLFTKESYAAATTDCTDNKAGCMLPGNCPTGYSEGTDTKCTSGTVCCVPPVGETVDTCAAQSGTCLYSCTAPSTNKGTKPDCATGQTCCVAAPIVPPAAVNNDTTGGLVKCGTGDTFAAATECNFAAFMDLIQRLINFMLFVLALPFAALSFAWAGYLYMSASGNPSNVSKAHEIFKDVATGLIIAFAAWLIIHAIVSGLGVSETYNFLGS